MLNAATIPQVEKRVRQQIVVMIVKTTTLPTSANVLSRNVWAYGEIKYVAGLNILGDRIVSFFLMLFGRPKRFVRVLKSVY